MDFNSIGYFQFQNLIQSKVPMILLILDEIDLKPWYNSLIQMHLENISVTCHASAALKVIDDKNLPKHYAIVVLDLKGKESPKVAQGLEKAGFINAYYVRGGFLGIAEERKI